MYGSFGKGFEKTSTAGTDPESYSGDGRYRRTFERYGGRSKRELFYIDHFQEIEKLFPNFKFHLVLSEPLPEDNWKVKKSMDDTEGDGFIGFVHQSFIDNYLKKHSAPEDIEFYFCGPPMMNKAVLKMCDDWGVPKENVSFDDFGG